MMIIHRCQYLYISYCVKLGYKIETNGFSVLSVAIFCTFTVYYFFFLLLWLSGPDQELCVRRRFLKKSRGKDMLMTTSYGRLQAGLPPRLQPCPGNLASVRGPGVHSPTPPQTSVACEHYRPHSPRPPRGYGPSRLENRFFMLLKLLKYKRNPSYCVYENKLVGAALLVLYYLLSASSVNIRITPSYSV